ncbi:DNA alkylation repair protein [Paludibaculum fermentans]|uniref:DNA alkylation repair protein n=1 Tax=Paludibaculum fermentans TaxID=1473598 RepID=A0A7S7NWM9_PALFE|nr:DNA alkylation repair protein [Paludibaculum fermentans]QOY91106.1 DNA alkylation repair protein [Paludibaculum fermentans]
MTLQEAMQTLESLGTEQARKIYRRHGAVEPMFGVSFANFGKLQKKIKQDHALAGQLWATGNFDARVLATMIADPQAMTPAELDRWVKDLEGYSLTDLFGKFAAQTPHARKMREKWMKSKEEFTAQAGWLLLSYAISGGEDLSDEYLKETLAFIEKNIHKSMNRVRHSMNGVMINIGIHREPLRPLVLVTAARIGKVVVDHGETSCETPDAASYIAKTLAHYARKKGA